MMVKHSGGSIRIEQKMEGPMHREMITEILLKRIQELRVDKSCFD